MEIVLAVLLLLGGFTLGSIAADEGDVAQSITTLPNTDSAPDSYPVTQAMRQSDSTRCHSGGFVSYQDLTVPTRGKIERSTLTVSDCEGKCADE